MYQTTICVLNSPFAQTTIYTHLLSQVLIAPFAHCIEVMSGRDDDDVPSQILEHAFLGSRKHARNKELLVRLSITHILNVRILDSWSKMLRDWRMDDVGDTSEENGPGGRCTQFLRKRKALHVSSVSHFRQSSGGYLSCTGRLHRLYRPSKVLW